MSNENGALRLLVVPGDGIGREVIPAALEVLQAVAPNVEAAEAQAGWAVFQETGAALPDETLAAARTADAVLFGAVASPSHAVAGYRSPIIAMRRALDLYANIRPIRSENRESRTENHATRVPQGSQFSVPGSTNLVVVRENTEDLYSGRERLEDDGATAIAERVITRRASERIVRTAYELAQQRKAAGDGPGKVTIVHKANVLRVSDGLFRETALGIAREFPDIQTDELLVDTAAMHLARSGARFDVIVTTNMFGDILSDIAAIHGGGLGLASSANIGKRQALFEPVHGAAPDIFGKGIANPLAAIGCVAMLLDWFASRQSADASQQSSAAARRVREAIATVLRDGPHTPDLGGTATTTDVTAAVIKQLS